jgi:hypothetical protein
MSASKKAAYVGLFLLLFQLSSEVAFAKKKDFKGLFGSYRREKYTENEGNDSDFGMDLMLSTLYPVSSFASSVDAGNNSSMPATISFNFELNFYKTFGYHTMAYLSIGHHAYDTRQALSTQLSNPIDENGNPTTTDISNISQFNLYEQTSIPVLLGLKYRFSRSDFVPYIGVAGGISFMTRKASYNFSNLSHEDHPKALTFQGYGGFEFFFAPGAGLRLELGVHAALAPEKVNVTNSTQVPNIIFPKNPIALRYASGVFILF